LQATELRSSKLGHVKDTEQDLPSRRIRMSPLPAYRAPIAENLLLAREVTTECQFLRAWHGRCDASSERRRTVAGEEINMLWTIFVVLLVLWALGMVSSYTMGGFIHILLVIAIAVVLIRIIQGRRPV
jgi:Flp pilus assembly protein TadB